MKIVTTIFAALFFVTNVFAQSTLPGCFPFPKTISVIGSAEMDVVPDEIYVQVDLREYKKKGEDKTELEKIKSEFLINCKVLGIADSNIVVASYDGYNMSTIWRRRKKDPDLMASIIYQIKFTNTKLIDALVDKLDDQATSNFGIVKTSHSKIREYRKQLKASAIKAAKEKAIYLIESISEQLGQAITIEEPEESINSEVANAKYRGSNSLVKFKASFDSYDVPDNAIDFKKIKIKFDVKVLFALK
jgi:uncharacterized protein